MDISYTLEMLHLRLWFRVMLSDKLSLFSSSFHRYATRSVRNIASVQDLIWSLYVKEDCNSFRIKKSSLRQ